MSNDDFRRMLRRVESSVVRRQLTRRESTSSSRSCATYTELSVLLRSISPLRIWQLIGECTLKVTAVCATAYAASVMAMLGTVCFLHESPMSPSAVQQAISQTFLRQNGQQSAVAEMIGACQNGTTSTDALLTEQATDAPGRAPYTMRITLFSSIGVSTIMVIRATFPILLVFLDPSLDSSSDASTTSFVLASLAAASAAAATSIKGSKNNTGKMEGAGKKLCRVS